MNTKTNPKLTLRPCSSLKPSPCFRSDRKPCNNWRKKAFPRLPNSRRNCSAACNSISPPLAVTGAKIQAKAKLFTPVDAKIELQWGNNPQIKANIQPPSQKRDLLVLESRPITYTRDWQQYLKNPTDQNNEDEQTVAGEE